MNVFVFFFSVLPCSFWFLLFEFNVMSPHLPPLISDAHCLCFNLGVARSIARWFADGYSHHCRVRHHGWPKKMVPFFSFFFRFVVVVVRACVSGFLIPFRVAL